MAEDSRDPLCGETRLTAQLDGSGLSVAAKSRALTALDRIAGNIIYNLGARGERKAVMAQAQNSAYEQIVKAASDKLAADIGSSSPDAIRVLQKMLDKGLRQQGSLDVIAAKTIEHLATPAPEGQSGSQQSTLDDDWLNMFSRLAAEATSERLRDLWSRVLAGEVRKPNSFSLTTLRVMSEMDWTIASKFSALVRNRMSNGTILRQDDLKSEVLLELIGLQEVGLLQGVRNDDSQTFDPENGIVAIENGNSALVIKSDAQVAVPVFFITRAGRELAGLLPAEGDDVALREIADYLKASVESINLAKILRFVDGGIEVDDDSFEQLHPAEGS